MRPKLLGRVLTFAGVTALVIVISLYWNSGKNSPPGPDRREAGTETAVHSYDWSDWNLPAGADQDVSEASPSSDFPGSHTLTVPGTVKFLGGDPERLNIKIHVRSVKSAPPDQPEMDSGAIRLGSASAGNSGRNLGEKSFTTSVQTDSSGRFRLRNAPVGLYRATVTDSNWVGRSPQPQLQTRASTGPLRVTARRYARLIGTVTNANKTPLGNATIHRSDSSAVLRTSDTGRFEVTRINPIRSPELTVSGPGYASRTISLTGINAGETQRRTIRLHRYGGLTVTVRSRMGGPIDSGKLRLTRVEQTGSDRPDYTTVAEQSIAGNGRMSFTGLRPGRYVVDYRAPQYLSDPRTLTVTGGDTPSVTLTPRRMEPLEIGVVPESGGRPLPFLVPELTAFDGEGNRLEPGVFVQDLSGSGMLAGYVHPDVQRIRAVIESNRITNSPRTFTIRRSDLPTVTLPVSLRSKPGKSRAARLNLQLPDSRRGNGITGLQVFLVNREQHKLTLARGGNPAVLNEPLSLPGGSYVLYGIVNDESSTPGVFHRSLTVAPGEGVTERIQLSEPATMRGTLDLPKTPGESYRVGVLVGSGTPGDTQPYLPGPLQTTVNPDGDFRIDLVPPGVPLTLLVYETGEGSKTLLVEETVRPLGRGETLDLNTLRIDR